MSHILLEIAFGVSLLFIGTPYVAYPLCLLGLRALLARRKPCVPSERCPSVTMVISAYNEEAVIDAKLQNCLSLDYPRERLEIVVISDASTDSTDQLVASYADRGVRLARQGLRRGKSAALTRFVPEARGEILVFSDANAIYQPDAIRKLVRHFADPLVGFVAGNQRYGLQDNCAARSESSYWQFETWLKKSESQLGSVVGGDGAILAMRAELFEPLRADDINDFYLPLRIVVRGYRGVFDEDAVCYEWSAGSFRGEFYRKVRIVSRSLRAVFRVPSALNPLCVGMFAFQLFVHKVLRWFVPVLLLVLLATNMALAYSGDAFYQACLGVQAAFYTLAMCRFVPWVGNCRSISLCYYFCLVNAAALLGILATLGGYHFASWTPQRAVGQPAGDSV